MAEEMRGTVDWFNVKRGFGFIKSDTDGKSYFVHYSAIKTDGFRKLKDNQAVTFRLETKDSDKPPICVDVIPA